MSTPTHPVFTPAVFYRDARAAITWLQDAFGFELTMAIDPPDDQPTMGHYELARSDGAGNFMLGSEWAEWTASPTSVGQRNTQSIHVALDEDIDAHCERARAAGATIEMEPADQFYGDRTYRAVDLEGHHWTFSQRVREVSKAEAEAAIGSPIEATNWT